MLIKWECGCLGLRTGENFRLVRACDRDFSADDWGVSERGVSRISHPESWVELPPEEALAIYDLWGGLISDGYRFRDVKRALGVK